MGQIRTGEVKHNVPAQVGTLNWQIYLLLSDMPWTLSTLEKTTARCVQLSRESFQNRPLTKANTAQVCRTDLAAHQTRSRTHVPILLCSTISLFTPALNWCCVVNLHQLPDGERLICWVTKMYTVPNGKIVLFQWVYTWKLCTATSGIWDFSALGCK